MSLYGPGETIAQHLTLFGKCKHYKWDRPMTLGDTYTAGASCYVFLGIVRVAENGAMKRAQLILCGGTEESTKVSFNAPFTSVPADLASADSAKVVESYAKILPEQLRLHYPVERPASPIRSRLRPKKEKKVSDEDLSDEEQEVKRVKRVSRVAKEAPDPKVARLTADVIMLQNQLQLVNSKCAQMQAQMRVATSPPNVQLPNNGDSAVVHYLLQAAHQREIHMLENFYLSQTMPNRGNFSC